MGRDRACDGSIRRASYSFCLYRYLKQFVYHTLSSDFWDVRLGSIQSSRSPTRIVFIFDWRIKWATPLQASQAGRCATNFAFNSILFAYRLHGWGSDGWPLASAVTLRDLVLRTTLADKCIFSFADQYLTTMLIDPCLCGDLAGPFLVSVGVERT